jgi:hypothetical protein
MVKGKMNMKVKIPENQNNQIKGSAKGSTKGSARGSVERLIRSLRTMLVCVEEECQSSHLRSDISEGRSMSPFPSIPLNLRAVDLCDEADETLEQVVAGIGVWADGWRGATRCLLENVDVFISSARFDWDIERLKRLRGRLARHLGLGDDLHDSADSIGSAAIATRQARKVSLVESNPDISLSAADAARVLQAAGVAVAASTIRQWAHRGKLASVGVNVDAGAGAGAGVRAATCAQGGSVYRLVDILALLERAS